MALNRYNLISIMHLDYEKSYEGLVCGVDEVGRGALIGDVFAAAVCFLDYANIPNGIRDSKQLSAKKRGELAKQIIDSAYVAIGRASAFEIDEINILQASLLAMQRAASQLPMIKAALIDGNKAPKLNIKTETIIKGDAKSISIAAASIVAKCARDTYMLELHQKYPHYGFDKNAGYGTKQHLAAISIYGVCSEHRRTFKPIKYLTSKIDFAR
jgi:ribonuclease HII